LSTNTDENIKFSQQSQLKPKSPSSLNVKTSSLIKLECSAQSDNNNSSTPPTYYTPNKYMDMSENENDNQEYSLPSQYNTTNTYNSSPVEIIQSIGTQ